MCNDVSVIASSDASNASRVLNLPEGGSVRLCGAMDVQRVTIGERTGLRPIRLPLSGLVQRSLYEYETVRTVVSGCSGVHLRVRTAADAIRLAVRAARVDYGELNSEFNAFAATVDGHTVCEVTSRPDAIEQVSRDGRTCVRTELDECSVVEFTGLGAIGEKTVVIWLPQTVIVDLLGVSGVHGEPVEAAEESSTPRWLHYGSSISHCHTPSSPLQVWPVLAAGLNDLEVTNLGFAGQCMLDPYVAKAIAASDADVITLSVGVNITGARAMNQRTFTPALHGFLDVIRERHPDTPIVLVSSIYWPDSDDVPGPSDVRFHDDGSVTCYSYGDRKEIAVGALTLEQSREELQHVTQVRHDTYGENIQYLDGLTLFGPSDVGNFCLPDGLHPDAQLYAEIARRFSCQVFADNGLVPRASLH
ncbi:SGNH/GDSL hydrolase family protein [Bifidobacterium sp.]|uniref:SGNH/GDSL hydrolase family protein n=1 Tax=Bifidobacterium TaxID=1678 RepID=UPI00243104F2|nr:MULTISPECIES: SGNH/GDSL hydrolase family protein [Bifidobacterium]